MSSPTETQLEGALRSALARLAPEPRRALLGRTLAAVAETPQRPRSRSRWTAWRAGWTAVAASAVVAAGVGAGILIGNSAHSGLGSSPGASPIGSPTIGSSRTPDLASAPPPPPIGPGAWERVDLPDAAPGVFSSVSPIDVVAFDGEYVAVGSYEAHCASDVAEAPPGCETALAELPASLAAVVWLSDDARTWELLPHQAAFASRRMLDVATDGNLIVASGIHVDPNELRPAVWVSEDARTWEFVESGELLPEQLVSTDGGFIGVRPTDDGPQFVASDDGRLWRALTDPGEQGPGEVMGLAVGLDGTTVVAVGVTYEYSEDGTQLLSITGTSWMTRDGLTWERSPANDGHEGAWISGATQTDYGWAAVGLDQTTDAEPTDEMAAWTSPDGLAWTRVPGTSIDLVTEGAADQVAWTGETLVASGTASGAGGSVAAFWRSRDGSTWEAVSGEPALDQGTPYRLVAFDGWVLATGARLTAADHGIGVVWLAAD